MGLDFIRKAAPSFTKAWNGNKDGLAKTTLFTQCPESQPRTVIADLSANSELTASASVIVIAQGSQFILLCGNIQVGTVNNVPADVQKAIHEVGGCALGRVVRINSLGGTADVEIS